MDLIEGLIHGFSVAVTPYNLLFVTVGVMLGTIFGLLPGLGPTAGVALLLPLTFSMDPASAIIMLAGIYYGTMYGGRIPSILINMPGDAAAVITTLDGYPLTKKGKAGSALGITAISSFIGGSVAIIGLTLLALPLAKVAGKFSAPELVLLIMFGILLIIFIGRGRVFKNLLMAVVGILVASIGMDPIEGTQRLTFGSLNMASGIGIVPLAIGLFGVAEVMNNFALKNRTDTRVTNVANILPSWADWVAARMAIIRSAIIGFFIGIIPGGGGAVSSVMAYGIEKRISKHPEQFGTGVIEGVAAPEAADNASSNSSFIPLLTLGIPPNPVLALIFAALLLQNITPGPQLINNHPDVFYGVIVSMYIGNFILLLLNLPMIRFFVAILKIPLDLLGPIVIMIAIVGVFSVNNSMFDVVVMLVCGVMGFVLQKFKYDLAPLILGFILGPMLEIQWRRAMIIGDGSLSIFVHRPASAIIGSVLCIFILMLIGRSIHQRRKRSLR